MAVTNYFTVDRQLYGEETGGNFRGYIPDALGSVMATTTTGIGAQNTYRYKPYGEQLAKTGGAADPKFKWVGMSGYRMSSCVGADHYVRTRHYGINFGQWIVVDPYWPMQKPFVYALQNPTTWLDPHGMLPYIDPHCAHSLPADQWSKLKNCIAKLCAALLDPALLREMRKCAASNGIHVYDMTRCLTDFCAGSGSITCADCILDDELECMVLTHFEYVRCPLHWEYQCDRQKVKVPSCAFTMCNRGEFDATAPITICNYWWDGSFVNDCDCPKASLPPINGMPPKGDPGAPCTGNPTQSFIHEFLHVCGDCRGAGSGHDPRFDAAAICIKRLLGC